MHLLHLAFFALNTHKTSHEIGQQKHKRRKHANLESHFTLILLPHSPPVLHFAVFWSPFAPHGEREMLYMSR